MLTEYDDNRHWRRTFIMDVDNPTQSLACFGTCRTDEKYADPGYPVSAAAGQRVHGSSARMATRSTLRARGPRRTGIGRFLTAWISRHCKPNGCSAATGPATSGFFPSPGRKRRLPHLAPVADRSAQCLAANAGEASDAPAGEAAFSSTQVARSPTSRIRRPKCGRSRRGW